MKQQVRFKRAAADREATQTRTLIADLYRIIAILDADIAAEEEQVGVVDLTRPEYPILLRVTVLNSDIELGPKSANNGSRAYSITLVANGRAWLRWLFVQPR